MTDPYSDDEYGQPGQSTSYLPSQPSASTTNVVRPFGRSQPKANNFPLAQSGAMPAGFSAPLDDDNKYHPSASKGYAAGGDPFDDDEGPSAYSFSAPGAGPYARPRRGRWARIKEDYLTDVDWTFGLDSLLRRKSKFDGIPREISLNDPEGNRVKGYESNAVATGKYGPITFLPKFLFG